MAEPSSNPSAENSHHNDEFSEVTALQCLPCQVGRVGKISPKKGVCIEAQAALGARKVRTERKNHNDRSKAAKSRTESSINNA
jgi:hypothetical protein